MAEKEIVSNKNDDFLRVALNDAGFQAVTVIKKDLAQKIRRISTESGARPGDLEADLQGVEAALQERRDFLHDIWDSTRRRRRVSKDGYIT